MEEKLPDNTLEEEKQPQEPQTPLTTPPPPPATKIFGPKKKSKKTLLLLLLLLLLVAGAAAAWYFFWYDKSSTPASQSDSSTAQTTTAPKPLYFQLGTKILAYNVSTNKAEVVTSDLPKKASVIDFYGDDSTWRVFYRAIKDDGTSELTYLEKGKTAEAVAGAESYSTVAASAEKKIAAYSLIYSVEDDATAAEKTTRSYLYKDGTSTEVYKSADSEQNLGDTDAKNPLYTVVDLSPDQKKLLFRLHSCFSCDGPSKATAFELDLDSKKTTLVYESKAASGSTAYAPPEQNGYLVQEGSFGLGPTDEPYELTLSKLAAAGGTPEKTFSVSDKTWADTVRDPLLDYFAVEERSADYLDTGNTTFKGLFKRAGTAASDLTKLEITSLPTDTMKVDRIGKKVDSCLSVALSTRAAKNNDYVAEVGVVCLDNSTAGSYKKVESVSYGSGDAYVFALPL